MRVICPNCEAVYKIADEKLVKEINRATCKRCGDKIVIYRPGSAKNPVPASEASAPEPPVSSPSGPDLERLAQMTHGGGLPSLGSLTAELRAISVPGVEPAASEKPASLGPSSVSGDTVPPGEPVPSALPSGNEPSEPTPPPVVAPAQGIPPSEGPSTKVYKGPAPMTASAPAVSPTPGPSAYTAPPTPPAVASPSPSMSVAQPVAAVPGAPPPMSVESDNSHTQVTTISQDASQVMGTVGTLGVFGFIGLVLNIFFGGVVGALGAGIAGFATFGCLSVSLLTQKGRRPGRTPVALVLSLVLGLMMALLAFLLPGQVASVAKKSSPAPAPPSSVAPAPAPPPAAGTDGSVEEPKESMEEAARAAEAAGLFGGLSADETEAIERVESAATVPAPAPAPAAKTQRRKTEPKPARTETRPKTSSRASDPPRTASRRSGSSRSSSRTLSGPRRANTASKPPSSSAPKSSGGPSPFVIDTIIRNNATIMRCVRAEEARGTDLSGKIYLKFTLDPSGKTSRARVSTSRFAGTALDTCISKELNALEFPAFSGKPKNITYPFVVQ